MKLFIWHPKNADLRFARNLFIQGFNAWRIPIYDFWKQVENLNLTIDEKQMKTALMMYDFYLNLKAIGYKFFVVDAGWGLGSFDGNYFYEKIFSVFEKCEDVIFDWGECYEDWVETGKMTEAEYREVRKEREKVFGDRITIGATARNKKKLNADSLTSYYKQENHWEKTDKLVWIFGQCAWHNLFGSLDYDSLSRRARALKINHIGLYQGNPSEWSWAGFENKLLDLFGKREKFEEEKREKFIKQFK